MSELMTSLLRAPCCQIGGSTHHMNAAVPRHGAKRIFVFNLPQKWVQHTVLSALRLLYSLLLHRHHFFINF